MVVQYVDACLGVLNLGRQFENNARCIEFDSKWFEKQFGAGTLSVWAVRRGETTRYPVALEKDGDIYRWVISSADTALVGSGQVEVRWTFGSDGLYKSKTFRTQVDPALKGDSVEPPEVFAGYMEQADRIRAASEESAENAKASAIEAKEYYEKMLDLTGFEWIVLGEGEYDADGRPTVDGHTKAIYFAPHFTLDTSDRYREWMWVNNRWELLGETSIPDLKHYIRDTDYATQDKAGVIRIGRGFMIDMEGLASLDPSFVDSIRPTIGTNEYWFVGGIDTGISARGLIGPAGKDGRDGIDGQNGRDGKDGAPGPQGIQGIPGKDGIQGPAGKDGKTPYIGDNNHWWIGDNDTGVEARGPEGPQGIPGNDGKDGPEGPQGAPGKDGVDGKTPDISIGSVETLPPKSDAYATITGTPENPVLNLGIPKGDGADIEIDKTLTKPNTAADAEVVGNEVRKVQFGTGEIPSDVPLYVDLNGTEGDEELASIRTNLSKKITSPVTAKVGEALVVEEVDGYGYPVKWKTAKVGGAASYLPANMTNIVGKYDTVTKKVQFMFDPPQDLVVGGETLSVVAGLMIRRKLGSAPIDQNDGELVIDMTLEEASQYSSKWFVDSEFTPEAGTTWYYHFFPYSEEGLYNVDASGVVDVYIAPFWLYGFRLDMSEADPFSNVTYIEENADFTPAHMDYDTGRFDYGSWGAAWFMQVKPCMLNYDGTVAYELDPNDYSKKADGTPSDISNELFGGNAMVGIPTVWMKIEAVDSNITDVRFCNIQLDDSYTAYAHTDENGKIMPYTYMPCYNGLLIGTQLRSLSGKKCMVGAGAEREITYAQANNPSGSAAWYIELFCDRMLINMLLTLIGKSTDTQTNFGNGHFMGGLSADSLLQTGTMNDKGLFYGSNGEGVGVKVFGIENWYGNQLRRISGWMLINGVHKIKMTNGTHDGSTTDSYNTTGDGYITLGDVPNPSGTSRGYISSWKATKYGLIPTIASGSATTKLCDGLWFNNYGSMYALVGGYCNSELLVGAWCSVLNIPDGSGYWTTGASLSCKPPVVEGGTDS